MTDIDMDALNRQVTHCRKCPRLVEWREKVAREKTRRFAGWDYWGRPVTGFGDPEAQIWIVGLAPAAHGGNRTGRVFTGDRSGDWLFRALHKAGFASQPESVSRDDGQRLSNCFISAVVRCAPPGNKPNRQEYDNCRPYLEAELHLLKNLKAILCLGQISFKETFRMLEGQGYGPYKPKRKFGHGRDFKISDRIRLFTSYHPSQQNTFTGTLTEEMFDTVFRDIKRYLQIH